MEHGNFRLRGFARTHRPPLKGSHSDARTHLKTVNDIFSFKCKRLKMKNPQFKQAFASTQSPFSTSETARFGLLCYGELKMLKKLSLLPLFSRGHTILYLAVQRIQFRNKNPEMNDNVKRIYSNFQSICTIFYLKGKGKERNLSQWKMLKK